MVFPTHLEQISCFSVTEWNCRWDQQEVIGHSSPAHPLQDPPPIKATIKGCREPPTGAKQPIRRPPLVLQKFQSAKLWNCRVGVVRGGSEWWVWCGGQADTRPVWRHCTGHITLPLYHTAHNHLKIFQLKKSFLRLPFHFQHHTVVAKQLAESNFNQMRLYRVSQIGLFSLLENTVQFW